jgi:anti-anti-sigma factor
VAGPLTLECSGLEYISSAGISVIMQTWKRLRGEGSTMKLVGVTPRVRNVFGFAGLDKVLDIQ